MAEALYETPLFGWFSLCIHTWMQVYKLTRAVSVPKNVLPIRTVDGLIIIGWLFPLRNIGGGGAALRLVVVEKVLVLSTCLFLPFALLTCTPTNED